MSVMWGEEGSDRKSLKQVISEITASEAIGLDSVLAGKRSPFRCPGCGRRLTWREYIKKSCDGDWSSS